MEKRTPNDELLQNRLDHVTKVWMNNEPFFVSVLVKEDIKNWYDYVKFVVNLDEINAMKNRNRSGSKDEDDVDEYDFYLPQAWERLILYSLSYVNELQIEKGVLNKGLCDITGVSYYDFHNYCDGNPPIIKTFTNDLARAHAAKVEARGQEVRRVKLEADAAQALRDVAWDEAYGSGARTNSDRSSRDSVNTPRDNKFGNFFYGPSRQEHCLNTDEVEDKPSEAGDNSPAARDNLSLEDHFYTGLGFSGGKTHSTRRSVSHQSQDSSHAGHVPTAGSSSSSNPSSKHSKKKKKKKKKPYGGGGGGGSSGGSSDNSSSTSSIPSHISTSISDSKSGRRPYRGAYRRRHQPRSKLKFDSTCFPPHSDQTAWTNYAHGIAAVLKSFNMQELIDPTFRPIAKHKEAFDLDNSAFYYILNSTVKSQKGREFVLSEAGTFDGQQVWTKMARYYSGSGSIAAEHAKNEVFNRINTPLLNIDSKRTRLVPTIAKWETDVMDYMLRDGTPLTSQEKLNMLKRFVSGVKDFDNVISLSTLTQSIAHSRGGGSTTLTPDELIDMYKQHASTVDANNKRDMVSRRHQIVNECRNVNHTRAAYRKAGYQINTIDFGNVTDDRLDDDEWYDVMMTSLGERKGFLPGRAHSQLTPEERDYWNKFSAESKELILSARAVPRVKPPPRRRNGGDAFRSDTSRVPNTPVAQGATANVTEQSQVNTTEVGYDDLASIPTNAPEVQANSTELWENVYNVNMTTIYNSDDFDRNGTEFIELLEKNRVVNETHREVNQTSELEPFFLPRFLSQPKKKSTEPRVSFADGSVSEMGSEAKVDNVSQSGSEMKVDSVSQSGSVATIDIQFHDVQSDDGTMTQLLVPSNCLTNADESRRGDVCTQEGRQLGEISQELSPAEHKYVPYSISFTGSSILDAWQESYPIDNQSIYDVNTHLTVGGSGKFSGEDTDATETEVIRYRTNITNISYDESRRERYGERDYGEKLFGQVMGRESLGRNSPANPWGETVES